MRFIEKDVSHKDTLRSAASYPCRPCRPLLWLKPPSSEKYESLRYRKVSHEEIGGASTPIPGLDMLRKLVLLLVCQVGWLHIPESRTSHNPSCQPDQSGGSSDPYNVKRVLFHESDHIMVIKRESYQTIRSLTLANQSIRRPDMTFDLLVSLSNANRLENFSYFSNNSEFQRRIRQLALIPKRIIDFKP